MRQKNFNIASDTDLKNSWYWSVLVKNTGSWDKAKSAFMQSKDIVDPTFNLAARLKHSLAAKKSAKKRWGK